MNWKNTIKNTFKNRKITPNDEIWLRLEKELDKRDKQLKIKWLSVSIAACIAFLVGIFVFYKTDFSEEKTERIATKTKVIFEEKTQNENIVSNTISVKRKEKSIQLSENQPIIKKEENIEINYDAYVDALASEFSAEQFLKEFQLEKMVDSIYKSLEINQLDKNSKELLAQTEIAIENYLMENYPTEKIISEVDREIFNERMQSLVNQVISNYEKLKIALNNN